MNYSELDRKYIWHPFTQEYLADKNINIVRGRGAYVYDENNFMYIDMVSSWWTNIHGH